MDQTNDVRSAQGNEASAAAAPTKHPFLQFPVGASVVITGAASGIGRATAALAAQAGLRVALWDLQVEAVNDLAGEMHAGGAEAVAAGADVSDRDQIEAAFALTTDAFGHVDYLVNNAGPSSHISRTFDDGIVVAAGSMVAVTDAWIALGRREGDAVVNLASVAGTHTGVGSEGWYPASKAAIAGYTRYLALQRPGGIRANAVAPGLIRTPRNDDFIVSDLGKAIIERNPMRCAGEPEDVGAAILFLLAPASRYINGIVLPIDGGSLVTL